MSDRADFCAFYYAQTGQAAVWIRDEKRFMFSNTELAWQSWQAAQAQAGDGEAPVAWLKPAHELVENSAPDVVTAELRGATIARGGIAASCMENYSVPLYKKQPAVNQQLLEALQVCEERLSFLQSDRAPTYATEQVIIKARAAIAAAQENNK